MVIAKVVEMRVNVMTVKKKKKDKIGRGIWICENCNYRTRQEKKAMKHSEKIVTATYHTLRLNENA